MSTPVRPVIVLHNGGSSHAIWDEVANRLADKYEIFALDLLGFGSTRRSGGLLHLGQLRRDAGGVRQLTRTGYRSRWWATAWDALSAGIHRTPAGQGEGPVLCNPLTEPTFLGGWLGPLLWLQGANALQSIGRCTGCSAPEAHQWHRLGCPPHSSGPTRPRPASIATLDVYGPYAATGQLESLLGVLDDLRITRSSTASRRRRGSRPFARSGAEEQDRLAEGGTSAEFDPAPHARNG